MSCIHLVQWHIIQGQYGDYKYVYNRQTFYWSKDKFVQIEKHNVDMAIDMISVADVWYVLIIVFQKTDRYEHLKNSQEKLSVHIQKLETIMRMVDNDAIPLEQVSSLSLNKTYIT